MTAKPRIETRKSHSHENVTRRRKSTDSSNIPSKVALRLWLLKKMGIKEVYVLDTCAGEGKIWEAMQKQDEITVRQWTRCDIKPRRNGVIKLDATDAIEQMPLDTYNVIDIDPYGEPWEPYLALLERITKPTAVFLTSCQLGGRQPMSIVSCEAVGIPATWAPQIPRESALPRFVSERILNQTVEYVDVMHAGRMVLDPDTNVENGREQHGRAFVTYYALGLKPKGA